LKTYLDFPKFSFAIHFESGDVPMEELVPFFKTFSTIFYFKFCELRKVLVESIKILKGFEFV
jgi:hypothetical protein